MKFPIGHIIRRGTRDEKLQNNLYTLQLNYILFIYLFISHLPVSNHAEGYGFDGMVGYMRERTSVELR